MAPYSEKERKEAWGKTRTGPNSFFFFFFKVVLDEVAAAERTKMEREKKRTERRGVL